MSGLSILFMKRTKYIILTLLLCFFPLLCKAQFYVTGDDPGRLRWMIAETDNYKIIFPRGNEDLAYTYGYKLEKWRNSVSRTTGYMTSGGWGTKMPVVLHTWHGENGSVAWAPKRMDLFTIPTPYSPEPLPWSTMLSIHESRHVSQMQFGMTQAMKPFNWIFGEMFNILTAVVYPGMATMEGDAVIMETAYSNSGRGRIADFLNYYRVAFDEGVERSWYKWRYGSKRFYTPNYYALGYITIGGIRTLYDCPDFMYRMYELAARRPYDLGAYYTTIKNVTGKKLKPVFKEISDSLKVEWKAEADARAPYIPFDALTKTSKTYTNYTHSIYTPDGLFTVKSGHLNTAALIKVDLDSGKEKFLHNLSSNTSNFKLDKNNSWLWWSESTRSSRWSLKSKSILYRMDTGSGKVKSFRNRELLHNPAPSPEGELVAVAQYNVNGTTGVTILESEGGQWREGHQAPDSLQIVELAWKKHNNIYCSAISDGGYGIYMLDRRLDRWKMILQPRPVMITNLNCTDKGLSFTSDLDGENELYNLDLQNNTLIRKSRSRFGLSDYADIPEAGLTVFSRPTVQGKQLVKVSTRDFINDTTTFSAQHKYKLAERLTEQERIYAGQQGEEFISEFDSINFSTPKPYRKALHAINVHSWAPFYVSVDNIMNASFDKTWQAISLGASGILQNRLATAVGEFGYSAHKDPYDRSRWRHSGHVKFTYSGLLPVFEASLDINDRAARYYTNHFHISNNSYYLNMKSSALDLPSVQGKISVYVPWTFNSGGWYRGFIPRLTYSINNDCFNRSMIMYSADVVEGADPIVGIKEDKTTKVMQNLSGSIRFYGALPVANSAAYPRWGGGIEAGAYSPISYGKYMSPLGYAYAYGYFPGFTRSQGLKVTGFYQMKLDRSCYFCPSMANTMPRGFEQASSLPSAIASISPWTAKMSLDYAIPVNIGEWPIFNSFIYINQLVLTPHFDCSFFKGGSLFSAGLSVTFNLETLVWIEWPCSIGVTASYNGSLNGSFNAISAVTGLQLSRFHIGPIFSVSF